jgi:branched-chain amino acid transport system substrate-binding protein
MKLNKLAALAMFALASAGTAFSAGAQTIKIGYITTYSGLNANLGPFMERAARLYIKQHEKELPPGVKVELVIRDDTGVNPDKARQLAQELIVRDKVNFLAGVIFTPNVLSIAPIATGAKVPFVVMCASSPVVTTRSPYIVRTSFSLWQSAYPLGQWASKKYKTAYTIVSDYSAGHDSEEAFVKSFTEGGGTIVGKVRVPLQNPDWAAFLQRVKDTKPEVLKMFIPGGKTATAVMKTFSDMGLDKAGIKLIGTGELTTDDELPNMSDVALGVTTVHHYSAAATRPANQSFVAEMKKEYGAGEIPNPLSVGSWDGMAMIFHAIKEQKGKIDPDKTMEIFKRWSSANSPRGPISIDPETRDIVQNEYLREIRKVNGQLANVEVETIGTAVKDPWKQFNK